MQDEFAKGGIPGFVHLYAGRRPRGRRLRASRRPDDHIACTHRGHGHCIAKGCDVDGMMAELFGKRTGCAAARAARCTSPTSTSRHARRQRHRRRRPAAGGRRGADREDAAAPAPVGGVLHRRRRLQPGHHLRGDEHGGGAATAGDLRVREQRLRRVAPASPITGQPRHRRPRRRLRHAGGQGRRRRLLRRPRGGARGDRARPRRRRPDAIEVETCRFYGHHSGRRADSIAARTRSSACARSATASSTSAGASPRPVCSTTANWTRSTPRCAALIDQAVAQARGGADRRAEATAHRRLRVVLRERAHGAEDRSARRSTRRWRRRCAATRRVIVIGEDVAGGAGSARRARRLGRRARRHQGADRRSSAEPRHRHADHRDRRSWAPPPGAAVTGLRPVAELMFSDFFGVCFDQIFNQAAKFRYMFGGKAETPLVIRTMDRRRPQRRGAALAEPSTTSSPHVPGLKVVVPSNAYDAKGLLIQAIRDDDPVIFCEHKLMYDLRAEVPDEAYTIPFGEANVVRDGDDVTIVALGRMVHYAERGGRAARQGGHRVRARSTRAPPRRSTRTRSSRASSAPAGSSSSTRRRRAAAWPPTSPRWSPTRLRRAEGADPRVTAPHTPVPFAPVAGGALHSRRPADRRRGARASPAAR